MHANTRGKQLPRQQTRMWSAEERAGIKTEEDQAAVAGQITGVVRGVKAADHFMLWFISFDPHNNPVVSVLLFSIILTTY